MVSKRVKAGKGFPVGIFAVVFFLIAGFGLVLFKGQIFQKVGTSRGLSGLVAVRGSVSLDQLNFSVKEISAINKVVNQHRNTFTKVDLVVDAVGPVDRIDESTELELAMILQTNEQLVVKSWSRKITRGKMVAQVVSYMYKAAREYKEFKRFPDVKQNFKTLYI